METRVIIADDHSIVRVGLTSIIMQSNVQVINKASSCAQLMEALKIGNYTHLILDIILPDGNTIELIEDINKLYPKLSILIHSMQPIEVYGKILKKYQIHSYLHKGVNEKVIQFHLECFINSMPLAVSKVIENDINPFSTLAVRELEVLHYLLKGYRTKEISTQLSLKMNTISTIKSIIFYKVKADSITHLLQLAHENQISY
jgi:DNA-binding NarL/FixJ family response regulator